MAEPLVGKRDESRGKVMAKADLGVERVKDILRKAIEGKSAAAIAGWAGCNPETVRRILRGETHIGVEVEGEEKLATRHAKRVAYNENLKKETGFDRPFTTRKNLREQAAEEAARETAEHTERMLKRAIAPPTEEEKEVASGIGLVLPAEVKSRGDVIADAMKELGKLEGKLQPTMEHFDLRLTDFTAKTASGKFRPPSADEE